MKKHKPNFIPLSLRIILALFIVIQAAYILAELATGIIILPAKNGDVMLTGVPAVMIAFSSLALCLAALATIVDHYDKRPNEKKYKIFKQYCFKAAFILFLFAPVLQLIASIFLMFGIHILPEVRGFAEHYTFYRPEFKEYKYYLNPVLDNSSVILWASIPACAIGALLMKFFFKGNERLTVFLFCSGCFGLCLLMLFSVIDDFLSGKVNGYRSVVYYAAIEPAHFNAVLLTSFSCAILLLFGCISGMALAVLNHSSFKRIREARQNRMEIDLKRKQR